MHRARSRLVNHRTALVSQMRGLLLDRGFPIGASIARARQAIPEILADAANGLTGMAREAIVELFEFLGQIDLRIKAFDRKIGEVFRANAACQRLARICGTRPLSHDRPPVPSGCR
uniref:RmpB-like protein n=1 Tax=Magnetospirillum gryphiswaldense TaxID=55518 RepID=A4U337_9PROT|nr:rmpB-like protein [Magnetospirillum gryphiswaldense MSR-1]